MSSLYSARVARRFMVPLSVRTKGLFGSANVTSSFCSWFLFTDRPLAFLTSTMCCRAARCLSRTGSLTLRASSPGAFRSRSGDSSRLSDVTLHPSWALRELGWVTYNKAAVNRRVRCYESFCFQR